MLKSKVGIWILAIIVSLIVFNRGNIGNFFKNLFYEGQKEIVTIQVKEDDSILRSKIGDSGSFRINEDLYFKFSIIDNVFEDSLADVVIERNSEKGYENYTKYEKALYSPIVFYVDHDILTKTNSSFTKTSDHPTYEKDISTILYGFLEDKTWKEIGEPNISGKIEIYIPAKTSPYYEDVCAYLLKNLDNNENKLNSFLEKCNYEENILGKIKGNLKLNQILIAPEFLYIYVSNKSATPIYTKNEVVVFYDIFIRNNTKEIKVDNEVKCTFIYEKDIIEQINSKKNFFSHMGLRVKGRTYPFYDASNTEYLLDTININ